MLERETAQAAQDWVDEAIADLKPILTSAEAMETLRISRRKLARLLSTGRLRAIKAAEAKSGRLMIPRSEVARYLRSLEVAA